VDARVAQRAYKVGVGRLEGVHCSAVVVPSAVPAHAATVSRIRA
jgi:hypothetical protein